MLHEQLTDPEGMTKEFHKKETIHELLIFIFEFHLSATISHINQVSA